MAKKILITGASGFLGSHTAEAAHEAGYEVHVLVRETSPRDWLKHYWLNIHTTPSVTECADIAPLIKKMDAVIHNAGATSGASSQAHHEVNVEGTKALVQECIKAGVKRFVYISSQSAGGPNKGSFPKTENDPDCPITSYGRSKKEAEEMLCSFRDRISVVSLRYPPVYGPRGREMLQVFKMVKGAFQPILGYKPLYTSMIYVRDAARAAIAAAGATVNSGSFYYVNDGIDYTQDYIYDLISQAIHHTGIRIKVPFWLVSLAAWWQTDVLKRRSSFTPEKVKEFRARFWLASPEKAAKELGWKPQMMPSLGFKETVDWYTSHGWL